MRFLVAPKAIVTSATEAESALSAAGAGSVRISARTGLRTYRTLPVALLRFDKARRIALVPILHVLERRSEDCEGAFGKHFGFRVRITAHRSAGLQRVFADCSDLAFAGAVSNTADALAAIVRIRPNIVLIDGSSGLPPALRLVGNLNAAAPTHPVLWIVDVPEMEAFRALQLGARGIMKKTLPIATLLECLRAVGAGQIWMQDSGQVTEFLQRKESSRLTAREKEVVRLICRGLRNKQIAEQLHITPGTVKFI